MQPLSLRKAITVAILVEEGSFRRIQIGKNDILSVNPEKMKDLIETSKPKNSTNDELHLPHFARTE
jgi:hypothetical protein